MERRRPIAAKGRAQPAKLSREVRPGSVSNCAPMYDEVLSEGVPDRFNDLVNRVNGANKDRQ